MATLVGAIEQQAGFTPKIFLLADQGFDSYSTLVETRRDLVERKRDLVQRFVDASIIGWYNYIYGDNRPANALIRKDNPKGPKTMDDLNNPNVTVAFVTGSDNDEATRKFLSKANYRAIPNGSISDLISELESRRSDALSTSSYLVAPVMSKYPYFVLPADPNGVLPVGICWGVPKNNPELKDAMNKFLAQELNSGDIDKLKQQWLTVDGRLATIDGFTLQGATDPVDPALHAAIWTNPGFSGTHGGTLVFNNIIQGNIAGIELDNDGTFQTTVQYNLFQTRELDHPGVSLGIYMAFAFAWIAGLQLRFRRK